MEIVGRSNHYGFLQEKNGVYFRKGSTRRKSINFQELFNEA